MLQARSFLPLRFGWVTKVWVQDSTSAFHPRHWVREQGMHDHFGLRCSCYCPRGTCLPVALSRLALVFHALPSASIWVSSLLTSSHLHCATKVKVRQFLNPVVRSALSHLYEVCSQAKIHGGAHH